MCGRYSLTSTIDKLLPRLRGPVPSGLPLHYSPRRQVRPGEPVLLQRQEHGRLEVGFALWGLLPGWSKAGKLTRRLINARSETVATKPFFRGSWRHRRCLIPADGFYEWSKPAGVPTARSRKQPWWIGRKDRHNFWLGGIWDRWIGADGSEVESCCLLTTTSNNLVRPIHDRMPVVVPDGLEKAWLDPVGGSELRALEPLTISWDATAWEAVELVSMPGDDEPEASQMSRQLELLESSSSFG